MTTINDDDLFTEAIAEAVDATSGPFGCIDLPWRHGLDWVRVESVIEQFIEAGLLRALDLRGGVKWVRTDQPCPVAEPTRTVYFCYDAAGDLLYIGCTLRMSARVKQHAKLKPWWGDVASIVEEQVVGWRRASRYEARCIEDMAPRYNVQYSNGRVKPRRPLKVVA